MNDEWVPIADFNSDAVPDLPLVSGVPYKLQFRFPFSLPDWAADEVASVLYTVLGTVISIDAVAASGNVLEVTFRG